MGLLETMASMSHIWAVLSGRQTEPFRLLIDVLWGQVWVPLVGLLGRKLKGPRPPVALLCLTRVMAPPLSLHWRYWTHLVD